MRNIAEIIKDDRNGKQLSQTERQIAVAYTQGKYDAVKELKIDNNSNVNEVLDKIRVEMLEEMLSHSGTGEEVIQAYADGLKRGLEIIDKYKAKSEVER